MNAMNSHGVATATRDGHDLLAAARDAFASGVHVVGAVSAILYVGLAIVALRAFAHVRNAQGAER